MKRAIWFLAIGVASFFSCEKEEFISDRGYPFLESISVSDINDTGATVNFEVKKNGGSITEHGIEFMEAHNVKLGRDSRFSMKISVNGAPPAPVGSIRIAHDLYVGENYAVRPYVKSGGNIVYGELMLFDSQGVHEPVVNEVSATEIFLKQKIVIKGDYFNSRKEHNQVQIVGLENDYRIILDSANRNELYISVSLKTPSFKATEEKFDLLVTSSGKSVLLPDIISLSFPKIREVAPLSAYVGDNLEVQVSSEVNLGNSSSIYLNYGKTPSEPIYPIVEISPERYRGVIPNLPPGSYPLSLRNQWFLDEFSEKVEILSSWETFQDGIQIPVLSNDFRTMAVGDHLLVWNDETGEFGSLDLGTSSLRPLAPVPFSPRARTASLIVGDGERYLYRGLGIGPSESGTSHLTDFYRYDILADQWEKLAGSPLGSGFSAVGNAFWYQGKIYAAPNNYSTFYVYDPRTNQWSRSWIEIPPVLKTGGHVVIQDYIYFLNSRRPASIVRYKIGGEIETFAQISEQFFDKGSLTFWDGNLIVLQNGTPVMRVNLSSKKVNDIQMIYDSKYASFIPWPTSQGLMMAFPQNKDKYNQENKIYRLIQRF